VNLFRMWNRVGQRLQMLPLKGALFGKKLFSHESTYSSATLRRRQRAGLTLRPTRYGTSCPTLRNVISGAGKPLDMQRSTAGWNSCCSMSLSSSMCGLTATQSSHSPYTVFVKNLKNSVCQFTIIFQTWSSKTDMHRCHSLRWHSTTDGRIATWMGELKLPMTALYV